MGRLEENKRAYSLLRRSWWVILFLLVSCGVYTYQMQKKKQIYLQLGGRLNELQQQLFAALEKREDLLLQIESQSDPAWIQMMLMKKLGLVPEGQTKVYFNNN